MNVFTKIIVINLMTVTTIAYGNKATASEHHPHEKYDLVTHLGTLPQPFAKSHSATELVQNINT